MTPPVHSAANPPPGGPAKRPVHAAPRPWLLAGLAALFLLAAPASLRAADSEAEAFDKAAKAFNTLFYQRAEIEFGEFVKQFPNSTNRARAILLQAEARHHLKRYDDAAELLDKHFAEAGSLADAYLFRKGEALKEKGDHAAASSAFQKLLADFPESPLRLQASLFQALMAHRQGDLPKAIALLSAPDALFTQLAAAAPTNAFAVQGQLLLAEAHLGAARLDEAKAALAKIPPLSDQPELDWRRHYLLARIELAGPKPELALAPLTNAMNVARAAAKPVLKADALNLEAEVHKRLSNSGQAIASYERIYENAEIPVDQRRLALVKSVELLSAENLLTNAIVRIEGYLAKNPKEPSADLLRVKAGELWLAQFQNLNAASPLEPPAVTNLLGQARAHFNYVITHFTNSAHLGDAWLNLGWTYWEEGRALNSPALIQESEAAFQTAASRLTRSEEQAMARFKLGDALFHQEEFAGAATNYLHVLQHYGDLPLARSSLFDRASQQLVLCAIEMNDLPQAAQYLAEMRKAYPENSRTEEAIFAYGRALSQNGQAAQARELFHDFLKTYAQSPLAPEVRFALAKTFTREGNWTEAIKAHEQWLASYTNHTLLPRVEFDRALLHAQAGSQTNAFQLFSSFVTNFPASPLAPAAQNWVADYYYDRELWPEAERNYQRVFQTTNWQGTPIAYHARLMAARTAYARQGYSDARGYLTSLINDPSCPPSLQPEAYFILGDVIMEQPITGSTNRIFNYIEAARVYDQITANFPSNRLEVVLAWGKKGDCHLQLAAYYPGSYEHAIRAYQNVLESKIPDLPASIRNLAQVGLARVHEGLAETKTGEERTALLRQSLQYYLDVVYGKGLGGQRPDPACLKMAGLSAGRVAERLGDRAAALELYRYLRGELPALRSLWDSRIKDLGQELASASP